VACVSRAARRTGFSSTTGDRVSRAVSGGEGIFRLQPATAARTSATRAMGLNEPRRQSIRLTLQRAVWSRDVPPSDRATGLLRWALAASRLPRQAHHVNGRSLPTTITQIVTQTASAAVSHCCPARSAPPCTGCGM
jgi:hypothetical protein